MKSNLKLLKHTCYNLAGLGLPLFVAVLSIPVLIRELGEARFGLLTLIWAVVSYFGLFDLGLGRALTQQLSVIFSGKDYSRVGPTVTTASVLMAALGIFAGVLMAGLAPWGVELIQSVPDRQETMNAVLAMALAMPAIILTSGFRGVLEARHAFGVVNLIRLPMGLFTFLGPLIVVMYYPPRLDLIAAVLAFGRIVACIAHAWFAWWVLPDYHGPIAFQPRLIKPLCVSGGWLTLSNVISPFMGYVDRFIIGGIVSAAAVAYYATPQEIVTKLWIIPGALTAVLFPTFAAQMARRDDQARQLFDKAVFWLFLALLPLTSFLALFARELLTVWLGAEFAAHSTVILQIFAVGIFLNCMAHVPFTLIQSAGAPRITALVHTVELPFFLVALWWLTSTYGVIGAALAWFIRMSVDTLLMFGLCYSLLGWSLKSIMSFKVLCLLLLSTLTFLGIFIQPWEMRALWVAVALSVSVLMLLWPMRVLHLHRT